MYILLFILLLLPALLLIRSGIRGPRLSLLIGGACWGALVVLFFLFLSFWGELLWFEALGFKERFWTEILAKGGFMGIGGSISALIMFLMIGRHSIFAILAIPAGLIFGGYWGINSWEELLLYFNRVDTSLTEPILELTTGFYLFSLPFFDALFQLLLLTTLIGLFLSLGAHFVTVVKKDSRLLLREKNDNYAEHRGSAKNIYRNSAVVLIILAGGCWLQRYHLLYSTWGAVNGPGWTDVHVRLPALAGMTIFIIAAAVLLLAVAAGKIRPGEKLPRLRNRRMPLVVAGGAGAALLVCWFVLLTVLPAFFQWLVVEPNEITREMPYISNNIKFTRIAFGLDRAEEREFPATGDFDKQTIEANTQLLDNIRLWDRRALDAVYKQFQEIRLYYEFVDVDIDRYTVDDDYRQVMVSAREMEPANLPARSRTFVNRRFKYTHGYGITMTPVSKFTPEGLPDMLIKDIPPRSAHPDLVTDQPRIYYGELTDTHVIANTSEKEFDYPRGDENVYNRYSGSGGVPMNNLWRRLLFGWKFDGTRLLFSGYPTENSRILFYRRIRQRLAKTAPFLDFDDDPYIVLSEGKLYWIIDGYTTSGYFPYSEPFYSREKIEYRNGDRQVVSSWASRTLDGVNYIRNSVKAVIDAYNGDVIFYVFDQDDPLIRAWRNIFPELFKNREEMPPSLAGHVRYPTDMLLAQGLVFAKYHMTDPRVFYNQEDLWIRATEKYYNRVQPMQPYYVMWEMPGAEELEFVLILPFTPKNRQVMIGWIAGMCDEENYGRFLVYKFPKEKRVLGPQQVETKIDQDRFLSGQLTLWDQRGSNVIRGNVLAIPIDKTILYVEPIYLQAETAAYPELRLVILMHNDVLTYGSTFDEALEKLLQQTRGAEVREPEALPTASAQYLRQIREANEALDTYLKQMGQGRFPEAAGALARLRDILRNLLSK